MAGCLLATICTAQTSNPVPWTLPGDFNERLRISEVVISGTIEATSVLGAKVVDGTELTANVATVQVDRVFQGRSPKELRFTWFTPKRFDGGWMYSGPPLADFRTHKRYLIFLTQVGPKWVVAMPLYALEEELLSTKPPDTLNDLSQATTPRRNEAIAEELEAMAMSLPTPKPGVTGEAPTYFASVYDLIGGCAEPFYRHFLSSPSPDLRSAARRWLCLLKARRPECRPARSDVQ